MLSTTPALHVGTHIFDAAATALSMLHSSGVASGLIVLLEGKGDPDEKDDAKATAARRWVQAVNTWGGLGTWTHHICYDAASLKADLRLMQEEAVVSEP